MNIQGEPFASATALSAQTNFDFFWECCVVLAIFMLSAGMFCHMKYESMFYKEFEIQLKRSKIFRKNL